MHLAASIFLTLFAWASIANVCVAEGLIDRILDMLPFWDDPEPSEFSVARWIDPTDVSGEVELVTLHVKASVPSLNLENIPGFLGVDCTNTTATARFRDSAGVKNWKREPTLLLIAGHHQCGRDVAHHFSMFYATSWSVDTWADTVVFQITDPESSGVTASYSLQANLVGRGIPDFLNPFVDDDDDDNNQNDDETEGGNPQASASSDPIPLNFHDVFTKTVSFKIPNTDATFQGDCTNCGVAGNTTVTFIAEGSLFPLTIDLRAEWAGSVHANIDLSMNITSNLTAYKQAGHITLIELPLTPFKIPGLFEAGPSFSVYGHVDLGIQIPSTTGYQLSVKIPNFNVTLSSKHGIDMSGTTPNITSNIETPGPITGNFDVAISPELSIGANVFGYNLGPDAAVARFSITEQNTLRMAWLKSMCIQSSVSVQFDARVLTASKSIPLIKPYTLGETCSEKPGVQVTTKMQTKKERRAMYMV